MGSDCRIPVSLMHVHVVFYQGSRRYYKCESKNRADAPSILRLLSFRRLPRPPVLTKQRSPPGLSLRGTLGRMGQADEREASRRSGFRGGKAARLTSGQGLKADLSESRKPRNPDFKVVV